MCLGEGSPLIGKQLSEPGNRVAHNPMEHVVEIFPRVDAARFTRLYQAQVKSRCAGPSVAGGKQPVLPSQGKGPDGILGQVVVWPEASVFQVSI